MKAFRPPRPPIASRPLAGVSMLQSDLQSKATFARVVFRIAGVWGFVILTPFYFMYDRIGRDYPPPITHPDLYYGFLGVTLAWQMAFLIIAANPIRHRPLMVAAVLEKFVYVISVGVLYAGS